MLKDTKSLGNNKAPACESRGFVLKKKVCFLTHLHILNLVTCFDNRGFTKHYDTKVRLLFEYAK